jgi:hypothetical protein
MIDETAGDTLFMFADDLSGKGTGPTGAGILPVINTSEFMQIDSANTGLINTSGTNVEFKIRYAAGLPINLSRPGFPENLEIVFSDNFIDTSIAAIGAPAVPVKFSVYAKTSDGDIKLRFRFRGNAGIGIPVTANDYVEILTATEQQPTQLRATWRLEAIPPDVLPAVPPSTGDIFRLSLKVPFSRFDKFTFQTRAQTLDEELAKTEFSEEPYVVPNPYVGAASFEPQRFAVSGRGERKIEFRNLPAYCTIRIFTLTGELVQVLTHDGNISKGVIPWNLRNMDQMEIAPGLYVYHVDGGSTGSFVGKFAVIK